MKRENGKRDYVISSESEKSLLAIMKSEIDRLEVYPWRDLSPLSANPQGKWGEVGD